jgi:predicted membrane metal-binding protein
VIMLLGEPKAFMSVSFWLTMVAYVGVLTSKNLKLNIWAEGFWIVAWVTPIIAFVFGRISILSPVTNLAIMLLVGVVTVVGMIGVMAGLVWVEFGKLFLWTLIPALRYMVGVVELSGRILPIQFRFNWMMMAGWYAILIYLAYKNKSEYLQFKI